MFQLMFIKNHWNMPKHEIKMFANDKSGRQKVPVLGTEDIDPRRRYWYNHHQIYAEYLSSANYTGKIANKFFDFFSERLNEQSSSEWTTLRLFEFLKTDMVESAIKSLFGSRILELNPDLAQCYWQFDDVAGALIWGLPKFLTPRPWRIQERFHGMAHAQVEEAWEKFDWNGPDANSDWDPYWGSRFAREIAKWFKESGFSNRSASGHTTAALFGYVFNLLH